MKERNRFYLGFRLLTTFPLLHFCLPREEAVYSQSCAGLIDAERGEENRKRD
jgi:hypothetical protein